MTKDLNYYIGIDLGGTKIKGALLDDKCNIIYSHIIDTQAELGKEKIISNVIEVINFLINKSNFNKTNIKYIGIAIAGIVDSNNGTIVFADNLKINNYNISKEIEEKFNVKVKIINDANASVLAEYYYGEGLGFKNIVMLTIGTGIGGGIILNENLFLGNGSAGAEIGHMVIFYNGIKCACGRRGCFEKYASTTAIKEMTKRFMQKHSESKMWEIGSIENITSKLPFDYKDIDDTANMIFNEYIDYLACGLVNIANIFRPEVIILGGGITNQGDKLIKALQNKIDNNVIAHNNTPKVKLVIAKFSEMSGVIGAICNIIKR